ncbi:MAG: WD40/YVTN/BNR-like repeat-containing protein [Ignavibacteria bacterium]
MGILLIGTRKGGFVLETGSGKRHTRLAGPYFLGAAVNHMVLDPRDGRTLLASAKPGHLGHTVYRSQDLGEHWREAAAPPAFAKAEGEAQGRSVDHVFWLAPGHAAEPGVWYAGTSPPGLFRSDDGGDHWQEVPGFNTGLLPGIRQHIFDIPDGAIVHSIAVDPRDAGHLYLGISSGGIFESTDAGAHWRALNRGVAADFLPDPQPEVGHDPHRFALHPLAPDRLYQQNHCGVYRLDRPGDTWRRIGTSLPADIGDIGFPLVLHPHDPETLWVFPMDGSRNWPRTPPGGRPAVYRSRDGGTSWERQDNGLPRKNAWWTIKRQAFCADPGEPPGLWFGTTSGEVWGSEDGGDSWHPVCQHLPEIYAVEAA